MSEEEKKTIDFFIHECEKYDGTIEIKGTSVGEETRILKTIIKFLKEIPKIEALEKQHEYDMQMIDEVKGQAVEWANQLEQEKEKYKRLSIEAQATAFEDDNIDTEGILRVLLKQGEITLNEKGEYQRKDFDWEENLTQLGLMKKREKTFYIPDDECLDEYTKQLESQLKEYSELKRIFREKNITNETMYDGFCRLYDEVENLKQIEQLHQEENGKLRVELNNLKEKNKDLQKQLNGAFDRGFISKDKIRDKVIQVKDRPVKDEFITATQGKLNTIIVLEELLEV